MNDSASPSATASVRRTVVWFTCLVVVTIAVSATLVVALRPKAAKPSDPLAAFKTVAITSGTLSTSESVNGTVELNDVTQVLHRIEGQKSATTTATPSGTTTGASTAGSRTGTTNTGTGTTNTAPTNAFGGGLSGGAATCGPTTSTTVSTGSTTGPSTSASTTSSSSSSSSSSTSTTTTTSSSSSTPTTSATPPHPPTTAATTPTNCATTTTTTATGGASRRTGSGGLGSGGSVGGATVGRTGSGAAAAGAAARVTQVVTSVIGAGAQVGIGTVLYEVESKPVVAMSGSLPAWRTLKLGVSDGPDVRQLELSLVALGYDPSGTMKVDDHFDARTKAAVERWQAGYGLDVTGSATLGSVVFLRSPATVSSVQVKIGDSIGEGDKVITLAAASQDVVINVPTGDESFVVPGFAVKVGTVDGTVSLLRSATQNGAAVVEAVITPSAPIEGATNGSTVKVAIQHAGLSNVLLAPAAALASRLDGSYALQVADASGAVHWVTVDVLGSAAGNVAVRGDGVADGTKVLQPR